MLGLYWVQVSLRLPVRQSVDTIVSAVFLSHHLLNFGQTLPELQVPCLVVHNINMSCLSDFLMSHSPLL